MNNVVQLKKMRKMGVLSEFAQSIKSLTVAILSRMCAEIKRKKCSTSAVKTDACSRRTGITCKSIKQILCAKDDHKKTNVFVSFLLGKNEG